MAMKPSVRCLLPRVLGSRSALFVASLLTPQYVDSVLKKHHGIHKQKSQKSASAIIRKGWRSPR